VSGKPVSRAAGRRPLLSIPIQVTGDRVSVAQLPVRGLGQNWPMSRSQPTVSIIAAVSGTGA
jgi:hypothetical protein